MVQGGEERILLSEGHALFGAERRWMRSHEDRGNEKQNVVVRQSSEEIDILSASFYYMHR
jgi:hypothetical protein